jgi:hypothetical protein
MNKAKFEDNVIESKREAFLKERFSIFADDNALVSQGGLLKQECLYGGGLFRAAKMYTCFPLEEDQVNDPDVLSSGVPVSLKPTRRMKGVPSRVLPHMTSAHFLLGEKTDFFTTRALRGTPGLEMTLVRETKKVGTCLNTKKYTLLVSFNIFYIAPELVEN